MTMAMVLMVLLLAKSESTNKGVNQRSKDVTPTQQQRPDLPTVTLVWHASLYKVNKFHHLHHVKSETDDANELQSQQVQGVGLRRVH